MVPGPVPTTMELAVEAMVVGPVVAKRRNLHGGWGSEDPTHPYAALGSSDILTVKCHSVVPSPLLGHGQISRRQADARHR